MFPRAFLSSVLCLVGVSAAFSKPMMSRTVPLERLLKNIAAYQKAHPQDKNAYYALGRAYYAAFSVPDGQTVPSYGEGSSDSLPGFSQGRRIEGLYGSGNAPKTPPGDNTLRGKYAWKAIENLRKAPRNVDGLTELTLGCVLEQGAKYAAFVPLPQGEKELTKKPVQWRQVAATYYKRAFDLSYPKESTIEEQPIFGFQTLVAYEAGESYLKTVMAPPQADKSRVEHALETLRNKPPSMAITPLVFSLEHAQPLDALLAPQKRVTFDLDGTGRPQRSPWLQPDTALLVWDPQRTGKITSGTQLFGSATWWMLFRDAYAALDALDDNRDGWLTGKELAGLSVWQDRNQNGISDPGEVLPLEQTGIAGIATRPTAKSGLSPMHANGLRLRDGRTLPTYDWTFMAPTRVTRRYCPPAERGLGGNRV